MKRIFYALTLLVLASSVTTAQTEWTLNVTGLPNRNICNYIHAPTASLCAATVRDSVSTVLVPKVAITADGGATWAIKTISPAVQLVPASIWMKDASTIFVPMYGNNASTNGALMRSVNGGTTWANAIPGGFLASQGGFPNLVAFTDAMTGICMGDPTSGYFEIYRTTNGGTAWTRIPQASIAAIIAADEYGLTDVYGVNGNHIWFGTNKGRVYHSADAGLTWTASATHYAAAGYFVSGIAMQDANNGFAYSAGVNTTANPNDDLARTADGGATWTTVTNTGIGFAGRGDIKWMPGTPNTYFASGTGMCKYSYDGGTTWVATTETNNNTSFGSMSFPTSSKGFAATNYYGGPVATWDGTALAPAFVSLLSEKKSGQTAMCSGDSVTFWVRANNANDPANAVALRFQTQNDAGVWSAVQTVNVADISGVTPVFTPDGGTGTVGTIAVSLSLINRFGTTFNEISRWKMQIVASAMPTDTTASTYVDVMLDIAGDPVGPPVVPACAVTVVDQATNTISVNYAACNKTPARIPYTVIGYIVDANPAATGSSYTATMPGTYSVQFGVDNGTCIQIVTGSITYTLVGTEAAQTEANARLFPNPATDQVKLSIASKATAAHIYDVNGRLVCTQNIMIEGNVSTIMTNTLSAGVYFLQTVDAQGATLARFRFVKQ